MRLKILFFPLMLVISVGTILLYGWPLFKESQDLKVARSEAKAKLEEIRTKSDNIEKLNSFIATEDDDVKLVYKFLSKVKNEEQIIDGINFIALNTPGIMLAQLSPDKDANRGNDAAAASMPSLASVTASAVVPADSGAQGVPAAEAAVSSIATKITAVGKYEDLKVFLQRLDNMQLYNTTSKIEIKRVEENASDGSAQGQVAVGEGEEAQDVQDVPASELLQVDLSVNFGYLAPIKSKVGKKYAIFDKSKFDLAVLDKVRKNAEIKVPELNPGDTQGSLNPFKLN